MQEYIENIYQGDGLYYQRIKSYSCEAVIKLDKHYEAEVSQVFCLGLRQAETWALCGRVAVLAPRQMSPPSHKLQKV